MTTKLLAALAVSFTVFAATTSAHADELDTSTTAPMMAPVGPQKEAPLRTESRWYGYQTMASDGAALTMGVIGLAADGRGVQNGFAIAGLATYALVPSVIHAVHGHPGKAAADLGLRVGAPAVLGVIGGVLGLTIAKPNPKTDGDGMGSVLAVALLATVGVVSGMVIASALDAGLLAREDVETVRPAAPKQEAITIIPSVGPTKNGFAAGLTGTF